MNITPLVVELYHGWREKWSDERIRDFLTQRAVDDPDEDNRSAALSSLAKMWPDERTREFITQRASEDAVVTFFVAKQHSRFGQSLFSPRLYNFGRYPDPKEGITQERIEKAAQSSDIKPEQIEEMVRSLSEHLGWDIRLGSQADSVSS